MIELTPRQRDLFVGVRAMGSTSSEQLLVLSTVGLRVGASQADIKVAREALLTGSPVDLDAADPRPTFSLVDVISLVENALGAAGIVRVLAPDRLRAAREAATQLLQAFDVRPTNVPTP